MTLDPGSCSDHEKRYFYNWLQGHCEMFYYTGCGGNYNNFITYQECIETCTDYSACKKRRGSTIVQAITPLFLDL
ncbi:hypothetical protein Pmani_003311 [Petrolisthes manimaculis]|uniref:BPTI/Kunitz inhibitor domain-containing protein n=1 Tax=Petrolisthes manimaculis TaxID=1843537 RepID=A0AAE1UJM2_9EUCA|nr:hypothetical protein Pmani_003311 [Petrolisthes manimaculis]